MPCSSTTGLYYHRCPSSGKTTVRRSMSPQVNSPHRPDGRRMPPFYQDIGSANLPVCLGRSPYPRRPMPYFPQDPYFYRDPLFGYPLPFLSRQPGRAQSIGSDSDDTDRTRHQPHRKRTPRAGMEEWRFESTAVDRGSSLRSNLMAPSCEPRIPLVAAAQQLDSTVRRAIIFFDKFYQDFRTNSDGHRQHADKRLMDSLWQSKIKGSSSHPNRKYEKEEKNDGQDNNNQNNQNNNNGDYQQNYQDPNGNNSNEKKPPIPPDELFSFRELQSQVLHRVEQLMRSKKPILPSIAPSYDSSGDYFDEELDQQQKKHYAAETLKEDIQHGYLGLKRAIEGMGADHMQAKTAIRKLKIIKQYLLTYRVAWDGEYEDDGGLDSDEEDEKRSRRANRG